MEAAYLSRSDHLFKSLKSTLISSIYLKGAIEGPSFFKIYFAIVTDVQLFCQILITTLTLRTTVKITNAMYACLVVQFI